MSRWLSAAQDRMLREMRQAELEGCYEDAEIVCDGCDVWIGTRRSHRSVVNALLRLCLIHAEHASGEMERYTLNEEGRAIVADPEYEPKIIAHWRSGNIRV